LIEKKYFNNMKRLLIIITILICKFNTGFAEENSYKKYLEDCSQNKVTYYYYKNFAETLEVEIYNGKNIDLNCLVSKFELHHKSSPVVSFNNNKALPIQKIIINKEELKSKDNKTAYTNYEVSSIVDQRCGESCKYTSEALLINKDQYWYIKGSNDRGLKAQMLSLDEILIVNFNSTHKRQYKYKSEKIIRIENVD